jgi:hypothetical protein
MKVTVRLVGGIRPTRPITPGEIVELLQNIVGKIYTVEIDPTATVQALADEVDRMSGIDPASTADEVVMERDQVLDLNKTLGEQDVVDGDELMYRFWLTY